MKKLRLAFLIFLMAPLIISIGSVVDAEGPPAEVALRRLLEGNERYVENRSIRPDSRPSAAAQNPLAVVLSCSDSRVPSELVFDQGVGGLFVVRAAGNTYDKLALESIEYAIGHLGTKLVLVIGHDQCGAVTAAVKTYPKPGVGPMLQNIYPAVRKAQTEGGDVTSNAIGDNAILTAERMRKEPAIAAAIAHDGLKVLPARYNLATGKVQILAAP